MQQLLWDRDGIAVLPKFYDDAALEEIKGIHQQVWRSLPCHISVDDMRTLRRTVPRLLTTQELQTHRFKVNDLYLCEPRLREHVLSPKLVPVLRNLLGQTPALCNTLSLDYGTAQPPHVDSIYMTPRSVGHLIATWTALEDAHPDAGPLVYYPGSHKIKPYAFSNGGYHAVGSEMAAWKSYMDAEVARLGIKPVSFLPKKGDVLVWHAHLLHGGQPIQDPTRTRRSLVCHFYSEADAQACGERLQSLRGALWIDRPPQPLSEQEQVRLQRSLLPRRRADLWARRMLLLAERECRAIALPKLVGPVAKTLRFMASLKPLQP